MDDPARKELKAQVNAAGRALAKKKREVIEKYGIEASENKSKKQAKREEKGGFKVRELLFLEL